MGIRGCELWLSSRVDEFLRFQDVLEAALPIFERSGNQVHLWNIGLENLSPVENERFNKGVDPATVFVCANKIKSLQERFPKAFRFFGFGFILFTPWTTLEDLRINIEGFRRLAVGATTFFLGTAMELLPGLAITQLALLDGLVTEAFEDYPPQSGFHRHVGWDTVPLAVQGPPGRTCLFHLPTPFCRPPTSPERTWIWLTYSVGCIAFPRSFVLPFW